jgi:hypothetical protein
MTYTIHISGDSPQAMGLMNLLKSLQKDYDFIEIINENIYPEEELAPEWLEELDRRAEYMELHPDAGKTWDEVKQNLLKNVS